MQRKSSSPREPEQGIQTQPTLFAQPPSKGHPGLEIEPAATPRHFLPVCPTDSRGQALGWRFQEGGKESRPPLPDCLPPLPRSGFQLPISSLSPQAVFPPLTGWAAGGWRTETVGFQGLESLGVGPLRGQRPLPSPFGASLPPSPQLAGIPLSHFRGCLCSPRGNSAIRFPRQRPSAHLGDPTTVLSKRLFVSSEANPTSSPAFSPSHPGGRASRYLRAFALACVLSLAHPSLRTCSLYILPTVTAKASAPVAMCQMGARGHLPP